MPGGGSYRKCVAPAPPRGGRVTEVTAGGLLILSPGPTRRHSWTELPSVRSTHRSERVSIPSSTRLPKDEKNFRNILRDSQQAGGHQVASARPPAGMVAVACPPAGVVATGLGRHAGPSLVRPTLRGPGGSLHLSRADQL